ncbi:DUF748 domain-containing protein [Pontibacter sp. G13]|uniref:DUF748 domain-containing protein n=1 Tax=Pontibacter sp. G13 TaxID=3074898 RepID=UPI00288B12C2|nr:DUF748 domain-containing protein [Pontibacter sp. G13]WNJ18914.1 hypothetical protein RJD25_00365 [Pontibacter sp. G13]
MKKILILFGVCVSLALIGYFAFTWWLDQSLEDRLASWVQENVDQGLDLSIEDMDYEVASQRVICRGIELVRNDVDYPDSEMPIVSIRVGELAFQEVDLSRWLDERTLAFQELAIIGPEVVWEVPHTQGEPIEKGNADSTVSTLQAVEIHRISIREGKVRLIDPDRHYTWLYAQLWDLEVADLHLDSMALSGEKGFFSDLAMLVDTVAYLTPDSLMWISAKDFQVIPKQDVTHLASVYARSTLPPAEVPRFAGHQSTWIAVEAVNIEAIGLWSGLADPDSGIHVQKLQVGKLTVETQRDNKHYRENPAFQPLPAGMVRSIPFLLTVDTVSLRTGSIHAVTLAPKADKPTEVWLDQMRANIYHLSNDPENWKRQRDMIWELSARFQKTGLMQAKAHFRLDRPGDLFTSSGSLKRMPLTGFNSLTGPTLGLNISQGYLNGMSFRITGNDTRSRGSVDMDYQNLKLGSDPTPDAAKDGKVKNFLGNLFLKNSKSASDEFYKSGQIAYLRNKHRQIFHFYVQSLVSGLVSNLGIPIKSNDPTFVPDRPIPDAHQVEKSIRKAKKKAERQKRKEARRQRKESQKEG